MKQRYKILLILTALVLVSCGEETAIYPKPISGMKLSFPEKNFQKKIEGCAYTFNMTDYVNVDTSKGLCNLDLNFTPFNATMFLTYIPVDSNLRNHIEYSRKLAYEHSIKADAINETVFINEAHNVYGLSYELIGDAASSYQFYLTDSNRHFLRGALYFNTKPNYDSLKPSISYLMPDFDTLFQTLEWQDNS